MNDQPLNDSELDEKIRSLVASAVADAPAPRPLPARDDSLVRLLKKSPSRRGLVLAGLGVAASLIAVALVWSGNDDEHRLVPATTLPAPSTSLPTTSESPIPTDGWPADVAVIIASDRGIERVTGENGEPVVTRLEEPLVGSVAFEAADGTVLTDNAEGELLDVSRAGEVLRLTDDGEANVWAFPGDGTSRMVGGYTGPQQLDWCTFDGADSLVCKAGTASVQSGPLAMSEFTLGFPASFTWTGVELVETFSGQVRRSAPFGEPTTVKLPQPLGWTFIDASDDVAVVSRDDGPGVLVDFRDGSVHPLPASGRATISLRTAALDPLVDLPENVQMLVTQRDVGADSGVWAVGEGSFQQVIPDATGPAFLVGDSIVYSPVAGGVSMRAADGTTSQLRSTGFVQDAALFGGDLFYLYTDRTFGAPINLYLHGPGGETYIAVDDEQDTGHTSWHLGRDAIVGTGAFYAGMAPNIFDHAGNRLDDEEEATRPANSDGNPGTNDRAVYSMSPTGLWGALIGDSLTLRQWGDLDAIETVVIPNWAKVSRFDVAPDRLLVTYTLDDGYTVGTSRLGTKTADGEWVWSDVPGSGVATLPRTTDPGAPTPPNATPAAPDPWVALAGDFGVRLIEGQTATVVDTLPATRVLLLRNGAVAYRAPDAGGYPRLWDRTTGQSNELWAGTNWMAEPTLQDSTSDAGNFLFTVGALMFEYSPERRRELATVPAGRLSYASNGWVVGNGVRYSIGDTEPPDWIGSPGGLWALSPNGELVASYIDGVVQVRRVSDGFVVYERAEDGLDVTEIDVNDEWLSIAEAPDDKPNADSTSRVVLIHLASERMHVYEGAVSASLPDTGL